METMEKNVFSFIIGTITSGLTYIFGGVDGMFQALVLFTVVDFITRILACFYTRQLSSFNGIKELAKDIGIYCMVAIATVLERNLGIPTVREVVLIFMIGTIGLSILENMADLDIKIPAKLRKSLQDIMENQKEDIKENKKDESEENK